MPRGWAANMKSMTFWWECSSHSLHVCEKYGCTQAALHALHIDMPRATTKTRQPWNVKFISGFSSCTGCISSNRWGTCMSERSSLTCSSNTNNIMNSNESKDEPHHFIALQSPHAQPYVVENDPSIKMYEPFSWKENPTYINLPKTSKNCKDMSWTSNIECWCRWLNLITFVHCLEREKERDLLEGLASHDMCTSHTTKWVSG